MSRARRRREARDRERERARSRRSVERRLRDQERELSSRTRKQRKRRRAARDVYGAIGFETMWRDGICEVERGLFSQTVSFSDVSYQSARQEAQEAIFSACCQLYDSFGADTSLQLSVANTPIPAEEVGSRAFFDDSDPVTGRYAREYNRILNDKMREGVSNLVRTRTITYAVGARDVDAAVPMLARVRGSVAGALSRVRCEVEPLDGEARLRAINDLLRPGRPLVFDWSMVGPTTGLRTKDLVCPDAIELRPEGSSTQLRIDGMWHQTLVVRSFGSELSDRCLASVIDLPIPLCATLHVQGMDKAKAVALVKQRLAWMDKEIIDEQMSAVKKGYDFGRLLTMYWRGHMEGDDEVKANVAKWFRGEYRTKGEARADLGVNIVISDDDWYDYLKLFAAFLVQAGYEGLVVLIDELVNLYKIPNAVSRQYNYEKILTMYNDTLQGRAHHLGIIMSGTPQSIEDRRRGIYSYEALRSRLTQGRFAQEGLLDMLAPVIRLEPLTYEELLVLIEKLANIHAGYFGYKRTLTEADLVTFLQLEYGRVGSDTHLTPREVIRDFIEMLDILSQNPQLSVSELLGSDALSHAPLPGDPEEPDAGSQFAEFTL